jgi:adenine-specific DNA-methyltransferase
MRSCRNRIVLRYLPIPLDGGATEAEAFAVLSSAVFSHDMKSLVTKFHGTVSLPRETSDNKKVAVKIVDDCGIESLKVIPLD